MKFKTLVELYLTFLTHNDSYMKKLPVGTILTLKNGDLWYNDLCSIDDHISLVHFNFIESINE